MKICLKENEFNPSLLQQNWCDEQKAIELGYTIVEAPADCSKEDFDGLVFNQTKYNERKQREQQNLIKQERIAEIQQKLNDLSLDFVQYVVGAEFDDLEERKQEFKTLHNELRGLLGKEPREYNF